MEVLNISTPTDPPPLENITDIDNTADAPGVPILDPHAAYLTPISRLANRLARQAIVFKRVSQISRISRDPDRKIHTQKNNTGEIPCEEPLSDSENSLSIKVCLESLCRGLERFNALIPWLSLRAILFAKMSIPANPANPANLYINQIVTSLIDLLNLLIERRVSHA
jgi:hypothetical protein